MKTSSYKLIIRIQYMRPGTALGLCTPLEYVTAVGEMSMGTQNRAGMAKPRGLMVPGPADAA